jgi:hypothetical protein
MYLIFFFVKFQLYLIYGLKDMFNLAKLVIRHFKAKFGPDLVHITNLVNLLNQTEFIDFTRVKSDFTGFEFLIQFSTCINS